MAIPVIVWGIIELAAAAMTAYEIYDVGKTFYDGVEEFKGSLDEAKKSIRETIKKMEKEIVEKIKELGDLGFLYALENGDLKQQSAATRNVQKRKGDADSDIIVAAIKQKIPFRKIIGEVCEKADKTPIFSLRKKKNVKISDLAHAKKEAMTQLLALGAEELETIRDIDDFIVVRLKQLVASLVFEFIDDMLEWKSPLKAEVCFGLPRTMMIRRWFLAPGCAALARLTRFIRYPSRQKVRFRQTLPFLTIARNRWRRKICLPSSKSSFRGTRLKKSNSINMINCL
jgi:hypothetical protein